MQCHMIDSTHAVLLLALIGATLYDFLLGAHHEGLRGRTREQGEGVIWVALRRCVSEEAARVLGAQVRGGAGATGSRRQ